MPTEWFKEAIGKNPLFWVLLIVALLMVGPTGINRMFDRFFPESITAPKEVTRTANRVEDLSRSVDILKDDFETIQLKADDIDQLLRNQRIIIRKIANVAGQLDASSDVMTGITRRISSLESKAWFSGEARRQQFRLEPTERSFDP